MLTWQEVIKESLETVKFVVAVAAPVVAGLGAAFFGYYSTRQKEIRDRRLNLLEVTAETARKYHDYWREAHALAACISETELTDEFRKRLQTLIAQETPDLMWASVQVELLGLNRVEVAIDALLSWSAQGNEMLRGGNDGSISRKRVEELYANYGVCFRDVINALRETHSDIERAGLSSAARSVFRKWMQGFTL